MQWDYLRYNPIQDQIILYQDFGFFNFYRPGYGPSFDTKGRCYLSTVRGSLMGRKPLVYDSFVLAEVVSDLVQCYEFHRILRFSMDSFLKP
jgi:hypothetical protein